MFDRFKSRYVFKGTLASASGLHIGGGEISSVTASDNPVQKNHDGSPYIPGSSLKGVMRSSLEALLRGVESDFWSCDMVSGKGCVELTEKDETLETHRPKDEQKKSVLMDENRFEQFIHDHSCSICRMFGSPFLGSKVFYKDLQLKRDAGEGTPEAFSQIEVRDFVAIDRDTGTAKHQGKFGAEIVPIGTRFDLEIVVENPDDHELGLLFVGFDLFNEGHSRIGGLGSRGLGRIVIDLSSVEKITPQTFFGKKPDQVDIAELRETAANALEKNSSHSEMEIDHAQANV